MAAGSVLHHRKQVSWTFIETDVLFVALSIISVLGGNETCEAEGRIKWRLFFFFFLTYKQKAPVDLLFLEFHTDNDVARIIYALSVTGGGGGNAHRQSD